MKGVLFKLLYKCGVCFYVTAVAIGCMSWQLWGCFCHDPAHGHPNEWNIVHTAFGPYVHTCQIGVAALLGIPWCAAVGAAVAVNLYVTVPVLLYVGSLYNKRTALRCLVLGLLAGAAQAAALQWGVAGLDIPPGFGLSGVPLGGVLVAALGALALFSAMAFLGYRKNDALGRTCERVAMWLVVCVGCGTIAAFRLHLVLGFAVAMDLIVAAAFGLQARAQFFGAQFCGAILLTATTSSSQVPRLERLPRVLGRREEGGGAPPRCLAGRRAGQANRFGRRPHPRRRRERGRRVLVGLRREGADRLRHLVGGRREGYAGTRLGRGASHAQPQPSIAHLSLLPL